MDDRLTRLEANYRNLERVNSWIANAESKASVILSANAVLLGLTTTTVANAAVGEIVHAILLGGYLVSSLASFARGVMVFFPRVKEVEESLFFFGSIARFSRDDFVARMKSLSTEGIESELIGQTHVNARIAAEKFAHVRWSIIYLAIAIIFASVLLILRAAG